MPSTGTQHDETLARLNDVQFQNIWRNYRVLQAKINSTMCDAGLPDAGLEMERDEISDAMCGAVDALVKLPATSLSQLAIKCAVLVDFIERDSLVAALADSINNDVETLGSLTAGWKP